MLTKLLLLLTSWWGFSKVEFSPRSVILGNHGRQCMCLSSIQVWEAIARERAEALRVTNKMDWGKIATEKIKRTNLTS